MPAPTRNAATSGEAGGKYRYLHEFARSRWHSSAFVCHPRLQYQPRRARKGTSADYDHEHTAGAALGRHKMAAAPLALGKGNRGLALRDANRPIVTHQKRVVGLEVTPDKVPTLRGVQPAVGFYAWATPHKKQQPRTRAISHPALREPISKATPLSQAVRNATARRDASIGDAYRAKHAAFAASAKIIKSRGASFPGNRLTG